MTETPGAPASCSLSTTSLTSSRRMYALISFIIVLPWPPAVYCLVRAPGLDEVHDDEARRLPGAQRRPCPLVRALNILSTDLDVHPLGGHGVNERDPPSHRFIPSAGFILHVHSPFGLRIPTHEPSAGFLGAGRRSPAVWGRAHLSRLSTIACAAVPSQSRGPRATATILPFLSTRKLDGSARTV